MPAVALFYPPSSREGATNVYTLFASSWPEGGRPPATSSQTTCKHFDSLSAARLDDYVEVPRLIKMFNKLSYFLFVIFLLCFVLVYSIY